MCFPFLSYVDTALTPGTHKPSSQKVGIHLSIHLKPPKSSVVKIVKCCIFRDVLTQIILVCFLTFNDYTGASEVTLLTEAATKQYHFRYVLRIIQ